MQQLPVQEALPKQFGTLLLTFENIAQSYYLSGRPWQALQLLQSGLQTLAMPEVTQHDKARFLLHYGKRLTARTQFENASIEEAITVLEKGKQLATEIEDPQLIADAFDAIGFAHYVAASNRREGDPHMFYVSFQEALERRRTLHDERGISESLFHLGLTTDVLDQKEDAHAYYTQALQIAQAGGYAQEASEALRHLGFQEQVQGNLTQALQYLSEALQLSEQAGRVSLPFAHVAVADVHLEMGNVALATSHCQQALELARTIDIKKALIFALGSYGSICQAKHEKQQARNYFEEAYAIAQAIHLKHAMQRLSSSLQQLSITQE
ncbi:tetratricopeptide repeat protein [Ktedonobacteria bacterium brp13]|nr:tetratricopeptide repeat protein [Ktedonobacteria bacterium brp13]